MSIYDMISTLDEMMEVQKINVDGKEDSCYHQGLYNGMEFARSIVTNTEPIYIDEDGTLDSLAISRNPERYI